MKKDQVLKAITEVKKEAKKRNFTQSYDLIFNLKNINIKSNPVKIFVTLPNSKGKKIKVAAFAGVELEAEAKKNCDLVISETEFAGYKADKSKTKKLAQEYDYFVAQATLMPKIAGAFGKVLGGKGKMPDPKLGCVVPPNANLAPLMDKLSKSIKLTTKKGTNLQCIIGKEDMTDDQVSDNIMASYKTAVKELPNEEQNIKRVQLKLTMGKPVNI